MKKETKDNLKIVGAFLTPIVVVLLIVIGAFNWPDSDDFKISVVPTGYMSVVKEAVCDSNSCRVLLETGRYTSISRLVLVGEDVCQFKSTYKDKVELFWSRCPGDE
jgi:hypothetical protein